MSTYPSLQKSPYRIRFSDCDPLGHLNNARYIDYFLNAREDHLREGYALQLSDFLEKGSYWVVTGHEILYRRPVVYNEVVSIASALIGLEEHTLWVEMQMWNESETELKALLWTRFTVVDTKTGRKSKHTDAFMAFAKDIVYGEGLLHQGLTARMQTLAQEGVSRVGPLKV
jgi:YbgC/YbaW family acyl-CoA thioester hydrolase